MTALFNQDNEKKMLYILLKQAQTEIIQVKDPKKEIPVGQFGSIQTKMNKESSGYRLVLTVE